MSAQNPTIPTSDGMLAYLVRQRRPDLADRIAETGRIETAVIGLGRQGTRHAGLMRAFGTTVTAAVAPEAGLRRVHETIPVYDTVADMLSVHPDIAAVSIWRHFSTAADAAIEAVEAGIPIVVLISEGIPVRDVRRVLVAARKQGTLLLGPNTPGIIFPPERVKVGMLPDVFYPAEPEPGRYTAEGVTICSRSGAILYHMSDALASAGIAQNAVIGVGGDAAVGSPFPAVVPMVMGFPGTDLVVVAGEIGGFAEELLAEDLQAHPVRYPKPMVALISGRCAPAGKTMGHAGAIVAPGADYGTFASKKAALEAAGITVVNSQPDLIAAVQEKLGGRTYFHAERYYDRMRTLWEAPPPEETWSTAITLVEPDNLVIRGEPLADLIGARSLLEVAALLVSGARLEVDEQKALDALAVRAAAEPVPELLLRAGDDVSKQLAGMLLTDGALATFDGDALERTVWCLGRVGAFLARILGTSVRGAATLSELLCRAIAGDDAGDPQRARMLEAAIVASVDHGVTPPSAQATLLASSVRAAYEVAVASGVSAITDVHGGAGAKAAEFFSECADLARREDIPLDVAAERVIEHRMSTGSRIEGLGHRIHQQDPRRDALWRLAAETGVAGACVAISKEVETSFQYARGMTLPVNVDGVIGAIVADMDLDPRVAKAIFITGRVAGLSAHYFEEIATQPSMRRIDFARAVYRGA
jgi:succinyl-CoA synthetase alpha subunit